MDTKIIAMVDLLKKIKKDCFNLKKHRDLTEYGAGQLKMIYIIFRELGLN